MSNPNASITITVRMNTSTRFTIPKPDSGDIVTSNSTIARVKTIIAKEEGCGNCPVERQRLIYKGRILSDDTRTLGDYGLSGDNQTIHLVKGAASTSANIPPNQTPSPTPSQTTSTPAASNTNPFTLMQQMMGQQGQGQSGQNSMLPNMAQMQQQLQQNPEMLSNIMQSPMMQGLMSNPEIMRNMMQSNPEIQRIMDQNPQLRAVLDDPEMMRRSMEMMRDPSAMQNMMRNQELAMSQIENLPGGFNALRRMYEDVQEPMMDAMSSMRSETTSSSNNSSSVSGSTSSAGADGAAMPNPWGSTTNTSPSVNSPSPPNPWGNLDGNSNPWSAATSGTGMVPPGMNIEQTISMLENPVINNMMQQMMADPSMVEQMMNTNPMMQQMRQANPAAAAMMSNPETMRSMLDPSNLRAIMGAQRAMQNMGLVGNTPGFPMPSGFTGNSGTGSTPSNLVGTSGGLDFSSILNPSSQPSSTPEQRFQTQLSALNDMGFTDQEANIRALTACNGNVNRAVERLLSEN